MGEERVTAAGAAVGDELRAYYLKALDRATLFQALLRRHRRRIARLTVMRSYHNDDVIVRKGEPGDSFHIIVQGDVLAVPHEGEGHLLASGDSFGELALIDGAPRTATVIAAGPVTTACIARDDFQRLLRDEPGLTAGLLPGIVLIIRDLARTDVQHVPDHREVGDWRDGADAKGGKPAAAGAEPPEDVLESLRRVSIFETLAERHLRRVAKHATATTYADGSTVVLAGGRGDGLHIILRGRARVRTPGGHTRSLGPHDYFGELSLIDGAPRSATVSALGELTTVMITRTEFQKLVKGEPAMAAGLLHGLVATVRDMERAPAPA
jgi:cAMP-dependent protein kinase regulator